MDRVHRPGVLAVVHAVGDDQPAEGRVEQQCLLGAVVRVGQDDAAHDERAAVEEGVVACAEVGGGVGVEGLVVGDDRRQRDAVVEEHDGLGRQPQLRLGFRRQAGGGVEGLAGGHPVRGGGVGREHRLQVEEPLDFAFPAGRQRHR
ncbi:hypothetical protein [Streptomyces sp. NPDC018352]|uniref:hypothetical protein n=1 Tax=Streptomyces sp. NPDC018352 TaxID=3157194 RepID=UPI0033F4AE5E